MLDTQTTRDAWRIGFVWSIGALFLVGLAASATAQTEEVFEQSADIGWLLAQAEPGEDTADLECFGLQPLDQWQLHPPIVMPHHHRRVKLPLVQWLQAETLQIGVVTDELSSWRSA